MQGSDESVIRLLTELRDVQKEHFAFYREVAQRSLDAQQTALGLQRRIGRLYRIVLFVAAIVIAGMIAFLFHLTH